MFAQILSHCIGGTMPDNVYFLPFLARLSISFAFSPPNQLPFSPFFHEYVQHEQDIHNESMLVAYALSGLE
jgi:hypothetical protein